MLTDPTHVQCTITFGIGYDRDGRRITNVKADHALQALQNYCCDQFQGFTLTKTVGGWVDPANDRHVIEHGYQVQVLLCHSLDSSIADALVEDLAQYIIDAFNQGSVVIGDGRNYAIYTPDTP